MMLRLYDTLRSGNAWKVRLLASLLSVPLQRVTLSIDRGDLRTQGFLEIAPLKQVPVLGLEDGTYLPESIAILYYLAQRTAWWPADVLASARVMTWLAFEQERHMKPLARLRLHLAIHRDRDAQSQEFVQLATEARSCLTTLERQLRRQSQQVWVASEGHPTIADIALYPYTCMAPMGGIELCPYPAIRGWLRRMEELPGYQPLFPGHPEKNFSTQESV